MPADALARSIRTSRPVTNWLSPACSASASFASRACLASSTPRRRALRRAPTSTVANSAASIVWPIASGSAGDDRSLGCTGRARGPLSAADAGALAAAPLAEDALGGGSRVGCPHAPPCLPGHPSFRDHVVAALTWPARLARRSRAAASPCPGAQGTRVGTAVYEPRAALSACARRR